MSFLRNFVKLWAENDVAGKVNWTDNEIGKLLNIQR